MYFNQNKMQDQDPFFGIKNNRGAAPIKKAENIQLFEGHAHGDFDAMMRRKYSSSEHPMHQVNSSDGHERERGTMDASSNHPLRSDRSEFKLDQTYLLCVDPQEKLPFQINMGTRMTIEDQQHEEITQAIKGKIERHLYLMRELLDEVGEKELERVSPWAIKASPQSEHFRRCMVQSYHLEQESQHYQRYIDKSDLSENLGQNYKQDIKVFIIDGLEHYDRRVQRNMEESAMDLGRSSRVFKLRTNTVLHRDIDVNGYFILNRISLLQTADQVIDMISTKLEKEMHLLIDSAKYAYILKFRNCDSYLYGPDQLVYFQDIRDALKYQQKIEVVVMVIDHSSVDSHFPPLLNYKEDLKIEEEKIENQIRMFSGSGIGSSHRLLGQSSTGLDQGIIGKGSDGDEQVSHGGKYQSSSNIIQVVSSPVMRRSSVLPDLFRKKEQINRMEVFDFKMLKYKKSSVFFWFKPLSQLKGDTSQVSSDGRPHIRDDQSSLNQYPSSDNHYKRQRGVETTGEIQDHFKISIKSIKNLGNIIKKLRESGPIKVQKIEYRDTTTKSRLAKDSAGQLLRKDSKDLSPKRPQEKSPTRGSSGAGREEQVKITQADIQGVPFVLKSDADGDDHHKSKAPKTFSIVPRYIQFQGVILLGSKRISTFSLSPLVDFININKCDAKLTFFKDQSIKTSQADIDAGKKAKKKKELLKISEIPSFARLCLNVILVEETTFRDRVRSNRTGYILGSMSCSIFDFKRQLRYGRQEIKIWPFEAFHHRLVCQGECYTFEKNKIREYEERDNLLIDVMFDTKPNVYWGIKKDYFFEKDEAEAEEREEDDFKKFLEIESEHLNKVKQMIDRYPEEDKDPAIYEPSLLFKYRDYVDVIPAFIKAVNFADPSQVAQCYTFLETNEKAKNLKPEEALALLDSQFGDEFVRIYALQRISKLDDYILALYMPQLVQALKYELFHDSVLSAFLLERAIKNTSVIGHAFYWSIKASMHSKMSFERYYLILERFLMCCGSFKFRLYNETIVTRALMDVSQTIQGDFWLIEGVKRNKDFNEQFEREKMNRLLIVKEKEIKLRLHLVCSRAKYDIQQDENVSSPSHIELVNISSSRLRSASALSRGAKLFKFEQQQSNSSQLQGQGAYFFNIQEIENIVETILKDERAWEERAFAIKGQPDLRQEEWMEEVFYFPIEPRKPIKGFDGSSGFFVSKKIPLRIVARLSEDKIHLKKRAPFQHTGSVHGGSIMMRRHTQSVQQQLLKQVPSQNKVKIMFKYGDDLRQDNLVLQFFKLMDRLWMQNGLNLEMNAYNVIETGNKIGFIEFVDNAEEISTIHKKYGNFKGPFLESSILEYVEELWSNDEDREKMTVSRKEYHTNFIKSTAGQCAATYILGIGDRHTGNYMIQKYTGRFFHIDFGHFLGHWKKKFGIRRDVEPFIFSREMCHFITHFDPDAQLGLHETAQTKPDLDISVQDQSFIQKDDDPFQNNSKSKNSRGKGNNASKSKSPQRRSSLERKNSSGQRGSQNKTIVQKSCQCFSGKKTSPVGAQLEGEQDQDKMKQESAIKYFEDQGSQAYNILRKNAHTLINLLTLMIAGDIVQLNDTSMRFLIDRLKLSKTDEEASADFKNQISVATTAWIRRVDSVFHLIMDELKKGKKKKQQTALTNQTEISTQQSQQTVMRKPMRSPPASQQQPIKR